MAGRVSFILGRAGSGKSRLVQDRILALLRADPLGPPVYLLVPSQATFTHERHYALNAGTDGYARLRVVGFEMLGSDVIAECGGAALAEVTSAGRQMLIGHLLRQNADQLTFFKGVARQTGLVRELDRTFAEFERAGRSSAELLEALPELTPETAGPEYAGLVAKARDLALIGDAYAAALGEDRLDSTRRLAHVMGNLDGCRSLRGAHVFADGFYRFTAFERKLLVKLAGVVRELTVALTLDPAHEVVANPDHVPADDDLFCQSATTYRQLVLALREANAPVAPPTMLTDARRYGSAALAVLERDWSQPRPSLARGTDASAVRLIEAPDSRAEADAAARQVKDWTRDGLRLRDVVVLCRDLSTVQPLLEAAFREHELPYFIDRRRPAAHHPLVRFVRSLLRVATQNWPQEAVMDLCKCGLAGMSLDEADLLENYALEHRIRGRAAWTGTEAWVYRNQKSLSDEHALRPLDEDEKKAEALRRRLVEAIAPLAEALRGDAKTVREHVGDLWQCLTTFGVPERLAAQIDAAAAAGRAEEAAEHGQAWAEFVDLLDQAAELLGGERLDGADFVATLEYGLDQLDLAIVPPDADEVILGDAERTRVVGCRAAVVMGMNDGTFPRAHADPTVLGDADRRTLRARGVDVDPDGQSLQLGERFLAYVALTTPAERLTLTRSAADDGARPTTPSPYWEHVRALLGVEPEPVARDACDDPACIGTPRQLATVLMRWARTRTGEADHAPNGQAASLYQFLATHKAVDGPLGVVRRLSWRALCYANEAPPLPADVVDALWARPLRTSVSRLETFAACPFKHYALFTLGLRGRDEADVTPRDLGVVYHGVLERLIRRCLAEKLDFAQKHGVPTDQLLPELTRDVGERLRGQIMLSSGRNRYLLDRVERTLKQVIAGQQAALGLGTFRPFAAEVAFGRGEEDNGEGPRRRLPPLQWTTPRGRVVQLHGQIDRVDLTPDGRAALVIDYKLARRAAAATLSLADVYHGLSLQLLVYLLVLQEHGATLVDPAPAPVAAFYVKLLRGIELCKNPAEELKPTDALFDLREKPRGLIDRDHLVQIDKSFLDGDALKPGKSDGYNAQLKGERDADGLPLPYANSDVLCSEEFQALLDRARERVTTLADDVLDGRIDVRPYKIGTDSACARCDFRSVCRFDPQTQDYNLLPTLSKAEVLARLSGTEVAS